MVESDEIREVITSGDAGSTGGRLIECERDLRRRDKRDDEAWKGAPSIDAAESSGRSMLSIDRYIRPQEPCSQARVRSIKSDICRRP